MAKGILIAAMNIGNAAEDEFHDWYDTEHLPERQRVPGFLVCQRWIGADERKVSVATYDLDGDCIEFLARPDPFFAEQVDDSLTVYRSQETGEIIGCLIGPSIWRCR